MKAFAEKQIISESAESTELLGECIGRQLKGGEVIELISDLGGGKTTFTRGLVKGLGSRDKVASPTFTVSRIYQAGDLEVHHFDFYRLQEPGIIAHELEEILNDPRSIVVVEWADAVRRALPGLRLTITIRQQPTGERQLTLAYPKELEYLLENI